METPLLSIPTSPSSATLEALQGSLGAPRLEGALPKLMRYMALLSEGQQRLNLVAPSTLETAWERHVLDSLQLLPLLEEKLQAPRGPIADIGSGAGFPGLALAIAAPEIFFYLIESITKKCTFLESVIQDLGLSNVRVLNSRAETIPLKVGAVTARAVASIDVLLQFTYPLLTPSGHAFFLKGKTYETEIAEARRAWSFDLETIKSITSDEGRILCLGTIKRHVGCQKG